MPKRVVRFRVQNIECAQTSCSDTTGHSRNFVIGLTLQKLTSKDGFPREKKSYNILFRPKVDLQGGGGSHKNKKGVIPGTIHSRST